MNDILAVLKDEDNQVSIPPAWRNTFSNIVEALKEGDYQLLQNIPSVNPVKRDDASRIFENIKDYGAQLTGLPEDTWQTSACQWMKGYWDVLVDLYTVEEGASDLVLSVRVYEEGSSFRFVIQSVYVP